MYIQLNDDFDPGKIADSGQCFRVKTFEDGTYRFLTGSHIVYITHHDQNLYEISCSQQEWDTIWHSYFDLDRDYQSIRGRIGPRDKPMLAAAENGVGIRILRQDPWEMLITFIISQQKTIPSIRSAVETLARNHGTPLCSTREEIFCFPSARQLLEVSEETFREYKLGYRSPYLRDAIDQVTSGRLDLTALTSCSDKKLFSALKAVSGVGDKVANCICLFAYGRTRLAPVDTWIQKVIDQKYKGKNPFPKYKDAAGIMQQYIFYYAQTHKEEF